MFLTLDSKQLLKYPITFFKNLKTVMPFFQRACFFLLFPSQYFSQTLSTYWATSFFFPFSLSLKHLQLLMPFVTKCILIYFIETQKLVMLKVKLVVTFKVSSKKYIALFLIMTSQIV